MVATCWNGSGGTGPRDIFKVSWTRGLLSKEGLVVSSTERVNKELCTTTVKKFHHYYNKSV